MMSILAKTCGNKLKMQFFILFSIFIVVTTLIAGLSIATSFGTQELNINAQLYTNDVLGIGVHYTPSCLDKCHLTINFTYSGSSAPDLMNLNYSEMSWTYKRFNNDDLRVSEINVYYNKSSSKQISQTTCQKISKKTLNNTDIIVNSCTTSTETVNTWGFEKINLMEYPYKRDIQKDSWVIIDFVLKRKPRIGFFATDFIPGFFGFEFKEFAWFNSSFANKKADSVYSNLTSGGNVFIYMVNWTRTANDGASCNDFRWVNESEDISRPIAHSHCNSSTIYPSFTWVNDSLSSGTAGQTRYRYYNYGSAENISMTPSPFGQGISMVYDFEGNTSNIVDTANSGTNAGTVSYNTSNQMHGKFATFGTVSGGLGHVDLDADLWREPVGSPATFCAWVRFPNPNADDIGILEHTSSVIDGGVRLNGYVNGKLSGGCEQTRSAVSLTWTPIANKWYHICWTNSGGATATNKLYINGNEVASDTANGCGTGGSIDRWDLAQFQGSGNAPIDMDSVVYAKEVLSADQIMALANTTTIEGAEIQNTSLTSVNESVGRSSIEEGIYAALGNSTIIYTDQQIYIRNSSNYQQLARFDKVTKFGSQRWAFNYISGVETLTNMPSLGNVFNVLEMQNRTAANISTSVRNFINSTKVS